MAELDKLPVAHTTDDLGRVVLTAESNELRDWVGSLPEVAFDTPKRLEQLKDDESGEQKQGDGTENHRSHAISEAPFFGTLAACHALLKLPPDHFRIAGV